MENCGEIISCCAYCSAVHERRAAEFINSFDGVTALTPEKIKKEKRGGQWVLLRKRLLPGYIFIYGEKEESILNAAHKANVRILRYGDENWKLRGGDKEFADWILEHDGVVELSKAINLGDRIKVIDGPLAEMEGVVVQVDKRRQLIKMLLGINNIQIWLSFDWVTAEV